MSDRFISIARLLTADDIAQIAEDLNATRNDIRSIVIVMEHSDDSLEEFHGGEYLTAIGLLTWATQRLSSLIKESEE